MKRFSPGNPYNDSLTNSEDLDEMPTNAAFHLGLNNLLKRKLQFSGTEMHHTFEIITWMGESINIKRVNKGQILSPHGV